MEIMSKVRKADWDKMLNGAKKGKSKQCRISRHTVSVEKGLTMSKVRKFI